jgi:hypothetical protein
MEHSPGGQTTSVGTNANTTMNRMRMPNAKERKEGREERREDSCRCCALLQCASLVCGVVLPPAGSAPCPARDAR